MNRFDIRNFNLVLINNEIFFRHPIHNDYASNYDGHIYRISTSKKPREKWSYDDNTRKFDFYIFLWVKCGEGSIQERYMKKKFIMECCHNIILQKDFNIKLIDNTEHNMNMDNLM